MVVKHFPEPDLVYLLLEGDERAFRSVFDRYHRKVYQFAYSFLKNKEQSEEIVQDTFLHFWLYRETLNPDVPIAPLLFTIARRTLIDTWRKAASSQNFRQQLMKRMELPAANEVEEQLFAIELERITQDAISKLNEQQQQVFTLS